MEKEIRVRMAPSPTGLLHIGTFHTSLFNWLFARRNQGVFILRIEDTDKERSKKEFEENIVESLAWLGINWDEFYRQSDRTQIYTKYINKLLEQKKAFWCFHSPEELEQERKDQLESKELPRHVCSYKHSSETPQDKKGVIRLAVDEHSERKIMFDDIIRGPIEFEERLLGDFSIAKDPDQPLYHFAVVIDDYEMSISHIIRGEDHISNTPKQILIQEALGFDKVQYAHVPLMLAPDRSKLSKRHGAVSVQEYKELGYLPQAILNYMVLLGFTPPNDKEIFTKNELLDIFDLYKVHKAGAVFDIKKLEWINGEHIKLLSDEALAIVVLDFWKGDTKPEKDYLIKVAPLMRERMKKLSDINQFNFLFEKPIYDSGLLAWKERTAEEIKNTLQGVDAIIKEISTENKDSLRTRLDEYAKEIGDRGLVYWPFRVALSGQKSSPDPIDIASVLGSAIVSERITTAIKNL